MKEFKPGWYRVNRKLLGVDEFCYFDTPTTYTAQCSIELNGRQSHWWDAERKTKLIKDYKDLYMNNEQLQTTRALTSKWQEAFEFFHRIESLDAAGKKPLLDPSVSESPY